MKKWSVTILLFVMIQGIASAHTGLKSSEPAADQTMTRPVQEVILEFETKIGSLSTLSLVNDRGNEIPFTSVQVVGHQLIGVLENQLFNGTYTVDWRIAGLDGHVIQRSFEFQINIPAQSEIPFTTASAMVSEIPLETVDSLNGIERESISEGGSFLTIMLGLIGMVMLGLLVVFFVMRRKLRKGNHL